MADRSPRDLQEYALNERLNLSEAKLADEIGQEKINTLVAVFKAAAEDDPSLWQKLRAEPDPYRWVAEHFVHRALN